MTTTTPRYLADDTPGSGGFNAFDQQFINSESIPQHPHLQQQQQQQQQLNHYSSSNGTFSYGQGSLFYPNSSYNIYSNSSSGLAYMPHYQNNTVQSLTGKLK